MRAGPTNPWLTRRNLNYAHQGGAREAPSSTLFAMRNALAAGATAVELDVHRTLDGVLVVCHDETVDRTTSGTGAIATLRLEQLRALDNSYWFVPGQVVDHDASPDAYVHRGRFATDAAFGIATLEEVLAELATTPLNLDIKQIAPDVVPYERQLAKALMAAGRTDDVIVASFHDAALDAFAAACDEIGADIGTSAGPGAVIALAKALAAGEPIPDEVLRHVAIQVPPAFGGRDVVTTQSVDACHAAGMAVHVWTIDDADEMARLLDLDVDGIMTDCPSVLAKVLGDRA